MPATRCVTRPAVWIPYEWGRSVNGVTYDGTGGRFGPFAGQLFLADLMYGGAIVRASVEKVNGQYQGACFPFWGQGLLGPVSLAFDPEGRLYVGGLTAPVTMALVAVNVLVYLITVGQGGGLSQPGGTVFNDGALVGVLVADGEWWRLVSAMFLHGSILHLAFNMFALYWLGATVEEALGSWRFSLLYFASGLAGSAGALLLSSAFDVTVGPYVALWRQARKTGQLPSPEALRQAGQQGAH